MSDVFLELVEVLTRYLPPFLAIIAVRYSILYRNAWVSSYPFARKQPYDFFAVVFGLPVTALLLWGVYRIGVTEGILAGIVVFLCYQAWNWLVVRHVFNHFIRNDDYLRPLVMISAVVMCSLLPWLWFSLP